MSARTDVLIVGGGIIGLACAHYLAERGRTVRIVEQGKIGCGASYGNCGLISPSHAVPLTQPGMIGKSLKWMLRSDSPFYVRPTLNPNTLRWFLSFARNCNLKTMHANTHCRARILNSSRDLYDELMATEKFDCDWQTKGCLFVYRSETAFDDFSAEAEAIEAATGMRPERLTATEALAMEPALHDEIAGAWFMARDAHLKPDRLTEAWRQALEKKGVVFEENLEVTGIETGGDRVERVMTSTGAREADVVVLAAGAWSPKLAKNLGLRIPIQPGKGYSITMTPPKAGPKIPCALVERKAIATPWKDAFRLGGTMEFSGYNMRISEARIRAIRGAAEEYLKDPEGDISEDFWTGWRPMTSDGLPIIGPSPRHQNLFVAAGHNMLGLTMAPATGMLVAELVTETKPHIDPEPYRVTRF